MAFLQSIAPSVEVLELPDDGGVCSSRRIAGAALGSWDRPSKQGGPRDALTASQVTSLEEALWARALPADLEIGGR